MTNQNTSTSIMNLEIQMGQLPKIIFERFAGTLPSDNVTNPKEKIRAIVLE